MSAACERSARLLACGATPELQHIQAELGARLSFREAARILDVFLPASRPHNHRTVSNRLAKVADRIGTWDLACPHRMSRSGAAPLSVFIDGAYIRAAPGCQTRHFEILMERVEGAGRRPQASPFCGVSSCRDRQARDCPRSAQGARLDARPCRDRVQRWR